MIHSTKKVGQKKYFTESYFSRSCYVLIIFIPVSQNILKTKTFKIEKMILGRKTRLTESANGTSTKRNHF